MVAATSSFTYAILALALLSSPFVAAQDFSASHNVTSLLGTWSSGSGAVVPGAVGLFTLAVPWTGAGRRAQRGLGGRRV